MYLARRLQDSLKAAWRVLWGRTEQHAELLEMRAQWLGLMSDVADVMDKWNKLAGRIAKRDAREMQRQAEPPPPPQVHHPPVTTGDLSARKRQLRSLVADRMGLGQFRRDPISLSSPPEEENGS